MADNGRWAAELLKKYGGSMDSTTRRVLEDLPPWIGDLGEPVDALRELTANLIENLAHMERRAEDAESRAETAEDTVDGWEAKYGEAQKTIARLEQELDEAKDDVTRLEDELDEARAELRG